MFPLRERVLGYHAGRCLVAIHRSMRLPDLARLVRPRKDVSERAVAGPALPGDVACRNCGASAPRKFCPECGQETRIALPTLRQFSREALGRLIDLDGRLWRSLHALVFKPGCLTRDYFAGRRVRYVTPGRLFLAMSVAMFAVLGVVGSPVELKDPIVIDDTPDDAKSTAQGGDAAAAHTNTTEGPIASAIDRVRASAQREFHRRITRFSALPAKEQAARMSAGVLHYAPYAMFALLPVFALLQYAAYFGSHRRYPMRPRRYAEHLVYGAHLFAFTFLMLLLIAVIAWTPARVLIGAWIVLYAIAARQAVYGGRWWGGLARDCVVALVFAFVLALTMVATVMMVVMLG